MSAIVRHLVVAMILALVVAGGLTLNRTANQALTLSGVPAAMAQEQPPPSQPSQPAPNDQHTTTDINVTETTRHETTWYTNPVWIVIGVLAVGVVIALIVSASRGGGSGTTVVGR